MIKNKLYILLYYIHIKYYFRGKCNYKNNLFKKRINIFISIIIKCIFIFFKFSLSKIFYVITIIFDLLLYNIIYTSYLLSIVLTFFFSSSFFPFTSFIGVKAKILFFFLWFLFKLLLPLLFSFSKDLNGLNFIPLKIL